MKGVSQYSNDPSVGWVSIEDVNNVMTTMIRDLDIHVMPQGSVISRSAVMQHFDTIRHALQRRCVANYEQFFPNYKIPGKKPGAALTDNPGLKDAYDKHRAEIAAKRGL